MRNSGISLQLAFALVGICSTALIGCESKSAAFAPVSGVVTLDGKPLPGAHVSFQPVGKAENPGLGSVGIADESGRFELTTPRRDVGAVRGKHSVVISAPEDHPPLPETDLDFEVPDGGTDQANFNLTSK